MTWKINTNVDILANDEKESIKPNQNGQLEKKLRNTENYLVRGMWLL